MDAKELKFLLKLLSFENYRAPLSKIQPTSGMKAPERNSICKKLRDRELVACVEDVTKIAITSTGKALLKLDLDELQVGEAELKVLQTSAKSKSAIAPDKTGIATGEVQAVIQGLIERGLIKAVEKKIIEVGLSDRAQDFLREEFESSSTSANIHLRMLTDYLRFLRKSKSVKTLQETSKNESQESPKKRISSTATGKPTDEEILQAIRDLDENLGTENYLPIFHLRQKFQPPLSRDELDKALYRLQRQDKIDLSSLVDPTPYTPEQIDAGIPKEVGGRLFFIVAN